MKFDINCDLGEGESRQRTEALMRCITSANVACGGHAGTPDSMRFCVRLAKKYGVRLGAHPGPPSISGNFGRSAIKVSPSQLKSWLLEQVGALESIAHEQGIRLHHVKLHGALYHASETNGKVARCYVQTVRLKWPRVKIFAQAGGRVTAVARRTGVFVWEEGFLDRGYNDDGKLLPRGEPGALLTAVKDVLARLERLRARGEVLCASGKVIHLRSRTLCIHSDTPYAIRLARAVALA